MTTARRATTGIGSLPHHNADSALEFSFQMGIPFLPQIPIRNPWEFMVAQALEGLPGLQTETDGSVTLNREIWQSRSSELDRRLGEAFERASADQMAFEIFEPSVACSSCWQPFLWELGERGVRYAKVQIAGPMTCQWTLRTKDGSTVEKVPELGTQIYRLVLARALAMARRLKAISVQPILYVDEPGLYALTPSNPRHVLAFQELRLLVQALRKEGVTVGVHCCSNTRWEMLLGLGIDLLSIDASLSLKGLLEELNPEVIERFLRGGGRFSLGVIPTLRSSALHSLDVRELFSDLMQAFSEGLPDRPDLVRKILAEAVFTPACGLALQTIADAELSLNLTTEFYDFCTGMLLEGTQGSA